MFSTSPFVFAVSYCPNVNVVQPTDMGICLLAVVSLWIGYRLGQWRPKHHD